MTKELREQIEDISHFMSYNKKAQVPALPVYPLGLFLYKRKTALGG